MIAALSARHVVQAVDDAVDPLRATRRDALDVILISPGADRRATSTLVRAIRNDNPNATVVARVGIYVARGDPLGPGTAIDAWGADGWLGDPAMIDEFVSRLLSGPLPVRLGTFEPQLLTRVAHRLFGRLR